jgi:hypothetical protein
MWNLGVGETLATAITVSGGDDIEATVTTVIKH